MRLRPPAAGISEHSVKTENTFQSKYQRAGSRVKPLLRGRGNRKWPTTEHRGRGQQRTPRVRSVCICYSASLKIRGGRTSRQPSNTPPTQRSTEPPEPGPHHHMDTKQYKTLGSDFCLNVFPYGGPWPRFGHGRGTRCRPPPCGLCRPMDVRRGTINPWWQKRHFAGPLALVINQQQGGGGKNATGNIDKRNV